MADNAALDVVVTGLVQGVMFRDFTQRKASELGLTGWVRNLPGGLGVEVKAEGERGQLEELLKSVKQGPPRASVEKSTVKWSAYTAAYPDFKIKY
jgi:acylphosphatase